MQRELGLVHGFRSAMVQLFEVCGCTTPSDCERWHGTSDAWSSYRQSARSSSDGRHHNSVNLYTWAFLSATLALALSDANTDMSWLASLPDCADSRMHCCGQSLSHFASTRVVVAEALEHCEKYEAAIAFAQAELQNEDNFNTVSRSHGKKSAVHDCLVVCLIRRVACLLCAAGRVLGRCHAKINQQALSIAALDAAQGLARVGGFVLSESLVVKTRAMGGRAAGWSGGHWSEPTAKQRLSEVAARMQGKDRGMVSALLALPPLGAP